MNKAIEFLYEYKVTGKEMERLDDDVRAALAITSFAVTEINTLMKCYIFSTHGRIDDELIDSISFIQSSILLRIWSAKIFEFTEFISLEGKHNKTKNKDIITLASEAQLKFSSLKKLGGYTIARNLRHEATNHYCLSPAKKNLEYVSSNANMSLYLHREEGNSYYPMGEEVMFIGRLNRHSSTETEMEDKLILNEQWMEWNIEATKWMIKTHTRFCEKLIFKQFPNKKASKKMYWIEPEMVGEAGETHLPLFMRADKFRKKMK